MKTKYIVLGNGFSIDIIEKLNKQDVIDLKNLFSKGSDVYFPMTQEKGFLSSKHCPNLWALGANSTNSNEKSHQLIVNIITCSNVRNLSKSKKVGKESDSSVPEDTNIYTSAYSELSTYLRYLFIHYNNLISDAELENIKEHEIIKYIKKSIQEGYNIKIISYNYDIILERLLKINNLTFKINCFQSTSEKIEIFKPHGSISFSFKTKVTAQSYSINSKDENQDPNDFEIKYDLNNDYPIVNALIPPAGDSERASLGWIGTLRNNLRLVLNDITSNDELAIIGVSYWHVDRNEIDEIIISMHSNTNVMYINPFPSPELDSVLSSIFKNYIHYPNQKNLI